MVQAAPAADDKENSIYTPAEESTARTVNVADTRRINRRQRGDRIAQQMITAGDVDRIAQQMMGAGDVDRIGYPASILDSIFQVSH